MRTFSVRSALAAALAFVILSVAPARAEELTGTWQGTLTGDGQPIEFTVAFSEDGYALYEYKNNKGVVQTVELSAPGQVQFVPPGGGVRTVAVESVVKRPGGLSYVLHIGFEHARRRVSGPALQLPPVPLCANGRRTATAAGQPGGKLYRGPRRIGRRRPETGDCRRGSGQGEVRAGRTAVLLRIAPGRF